MSGNVPPPMAPPPPPPPPEGWAPSKPTSGKAIAALICGLAGPVAAFFCPVFGIAVVVGLILGIIGIIETGNNGSRGGRGMAIAGTVLSALGIAGTIAVIVGFVAMANFDEQQQAVRRAERLTEDQELLTKRLQQYCEANGGSLGPGGPVLAVDFPDDDEWDPQPSNIPPEGRAVGGSVDKALELGHLVGENELRWSGRRGGRDWELVVTGQKSATLRARRGNGEIVREIEVRDAQRNIWVQTIP